MAHPPRSLYDKLWDAHLVKAATADTPALMYIDLHLIHEVTSPQAFATLRKRGLRVRRPERTVATTDHATPTLPAGAGGRFPFADAQAENQVATLHRNCAEFEIALHPLGSAQQGIVHVMGPEMGLSQPGMTIVCGDSHTSTHGAFGALAFGIGSTEVGYVLATQTLPQARAKSLRIEVSGRLGRGVTAKDLILALIAQVGVGGATGHVLEYAGPAITCLDMEERMTVCNMSIEMGARAGLIAPDDTTFSYLSGRPKAPAAQDWDAAVRRWQKLPSDPEARFDRRLTFSAEKLAPMITYGTNPAMGMAIDAAIDADADAAALGYMGWKPGQRLLGAKVDVVFIGSCTNARLGDLRAAASIMQGRKVAAGVRALVVPGSSQVKRQAEAEGLDAVFRAAGADWREAGCSMCIAMNGDQVAPGQVAMSTSNRNFQGRQGPGSRTLLASPLTAAAAATTGRVTDPRELLP